MPPHEGLRRAELIGARSLATDLGLGTPLETGLRTARVTVALAERLNLDAQTTRDAYHVAVIARSDGERITDWHDYMDSVTFLQQLGLAPEPQLTRG